MIHTHTRTITDSPFHIYSLNVECVHRAGYHMETLNVRSQLGTVTTVLSFHYNETSNKVCICVTNEFAKVLRHNFLLKHLRELQYC